MEAGKAPTQIRVMLTDDHAIVREGLRLIIDGQPGMQVVAEASDVAGAAAHLREHEPDVLLLDINLGGESGLDAIPALREQSPRTAIVILTMQKDPAYARQALEAGAAGYVVKESAAQELVRAIGAAASGQTYLQPELGGLLLQSNAESPESLTERELQVLRLIGLGHTNAEISERLYLSVRTIESHRARIQEKLGVSGRAELIRYALDNGLIER
jgi:two-component system, NarL family, response regulator NreC